MKYVHAKVADVGGWMCLERYSIYPLKTSDQLRDAGFFYDDDVVILDAKEFYRLIDGLDRTAE